MALPKPTQESFEARLPAVRSLGILSHNNMLAPLPDILRLFFTVCVSFSFQMRPSCKPFCPQKVANIFTVPSSNSPDRQRAKLQRLNEDIDKRDARLTSLQLEVFFGAPWSQTPGCPGRF